MSSRFAEHAQAVARNLPPKTSSGSNPDSPHLGLRPNKSHLYGHGSSRRNSNVPSPKSIASKMNRSPSPVPPRTNHFRRPPLDFARSNQQNGSVTASSSAEATAARGAEIFETADRPLPAPPAANPRRRLGIATTFSSSRAAILAAPRKISEPPIRRKELPVGRRRASVSFGTKRTNNFATRLPLKPPPAQVVLTRASPRRSTGSNSSRGQVSNNAEARVDGIDEVFEAPSSDDNAQNVYSVDEGDGGEMKFVQPQALAPSACLAMSLACSAFMPEAVRKPASRIHSACEKEINLLPAALDIHPAISGSFGGDVRAATSPNFGRRKPKYWAFLRRSRKRIIQYGRRSGILKKHQHRESRFHLETTPAEAEEEKQQKKWGRPKEDGLDIPVNDGNVIYEVLPFLPIIPAVVCFVLNIVLPGSGTILSGLFLLCCGHPRLRMKDGRILMTILITFAVGVAQFGTITFLLVGWFWSIATGAHILYHSIIYRQALKDRRRAEIATAALEALTRDEFRRTVKDVQELIKQETHAKEMGMELDESYVVFNHVDMDRKLSVFSIGSASIPTEAVVTTERSSPV